MKSNIFANIPTRLPKELVETLVENEYVYVERIVSKGHTAPSKGWFEQKHNEWVILLQGAAILEFDGDRIIKMLPGDHINIPAGRRHRVKWTDPDMESVWLAVFYS